MRIVLGSIVAICLLGGVAYAQQAEDPRISAYRQLLSRANDELSQAMGQLQAAQIENAKLKDENAKLKPKPAEDQKK